MATLEGPGITTSQCPTCSQPGWKNQLQPDCKLAQLVAITAGLLQQGRLLHAQLFAPAVPLSSALEPAVLLKNRAL